MRFEDVAAVVDGIPHMDRRHGEIVYEHVRRTRPELILELGTANGVSAAYMAAALEADGRGRVVTVDSDRADYRPGPVKVLGDAGLAHRVELVRRPESSYTWYLKELVAASVDGAGNVEPLYDFVFIDGAHDWTIDGLAAVLCEKLLRPGGWLLLDDLDWTYAKCSTGRLPEGTTAENREPHVRAVYDLIVKTNPAFTEFREEDGSWGWAHKLPGAPRRMTLTTTESTAALLTRGMRSTARRLVRR